MVWTGLHPILCPFGVGEENKYQLKLDEFDKVLDLLEADLSIKFPRMVVGQYRVMSY